MSLRQFTIAQAKGTLTFIREFDESFPISFRRFDQLMIDEKLTPEDVGETTASIAALRRTVLIKEIREMVRRERAAPGSGNPYFDHVGDRLRTTALTPKDIGESPVSLAELRKARFVGCARRTAMYIRANPNNPCPYTAEDVRKILRDGGATLEDNSEDNSDATNYDLRSENW